jgi:hypothetical protein
MFATLKNGSCNSERSSCNTCTDRSDRRGLSTVRVRERGVGGCSRPRRVYVLTFPCVSTKWAPMPITHRYMARRDRRTDINFIERFGWLYLDYEAHVFFYGLLCIVRRALFMVLSRIPDTLWQSTIAIVLVVCFHAFHLKLEP